MKIEKEFYIKNRKKLFDKMEDNSLLVLSSGTCYTQSGDEDYDFDCDKCFYYLTGINQAEVTLVMKKVNGKKFSFLFIEENDPIRVKWVGAKLYPEEAKEISGIDNIIFNQEFDSELAELVIGVDTLYLSLEKAPGHRYNYNLEFSNKISNKYNNIKVVDAYPMIIDLRFVKESCEVEKIKESIAVTKLGIQKLLENSRPNIYEYQLEAEFDYVIKTNGQRIHSFKTIGAGGVNATILHYSENNSLLKDNELVLFDLGCETDYYISDITRTFPINGKFTERQKQVYNEVLNVNKKCIEFLKPGETRISFNNYAKKLLTEACYRLGLIKEDKELVKYYWHSIGHSIGLDTHDPANYDDGIKVGSIMTVEPGLYIEEEGIGIRIEDNVLVTENGCINLSKDIIKEASDIEAYMAKYNKFNK